MFFVPAPVSHKVGAELAADGRGASEFERVESAMFERSNKVTMRRYLLGELAEDERARVEGRYLADPEAFEHALATENDLIDAYVRGELNEGERKHFEAEYLKSDERREKVEFSRRLQAAAHSEVLSSQIQRIPFWKKMSGEFSAPLSIPQWTFGAAALALVAAGSWLAVQDVKLRTGLQQALAEQAEHRRTEQALRQQIAKLEGNSQGLGRQNQQSSEVARLEPPMMPDMTFRLSPESARGIGDGEKTLVIPPTASWVLLQLVVDRNEYGSYEATLATADGKEVLKGKALRGRSTSGSTFVAWSLPPRSVPSGDYIIELAGRTPKKGDLEAIESYSFRVSRR